VHYVGHYTNFHIYIPPSFFIFRLFTRNKNYVNPFLHLILQNFFGASCHKNNKDSKNSEISIFGWATSCSLPIAFLTGMIENLKDEENMIFRDVRSRLSLWHSHITEKKFLIFYICWCTHWEFYRQYPLTIAAIINSTEYSSLTNYLTYL
jgi:hypothetical protein